MLTKDEMEFNPSCPIPKSDYDKILLAHGGGGTLSHQLLNKLIFPQFQNEILNEHIDSAVFKIENKKFAFTTDSYVVQPPFFPGGDIGVLSINGTINDLAVSGADPLYVSVSFIIEEGFQLEDFWRIILSMKKASEKAGVKIVTGDTKVVDRGKGDKIFINTSGIGLVQEGVGISPKKCRPGDLIIINGKIGEHGIAVLSEREGLEFSTNIKSDTAPLNKLVKNMLTVAKEIHCMRDPTRGGVSSSLNEIAQEGHIGLLIEEDNIPISEEVKGACEILGFDPLYIANEGKLIAIVSASEAEKLLYEMKKNELGEESRIIGRVTEENAGSVVLKTKIGTKRIVDMHSGELLPRIC
ncbi:MAG TPA: hydrogenase expression/formation protein HypE [Ignavibacteriaceae bacterium]|nr:hydrogenase expression/formation protein HypE [Ignavibacteriaceae bacterium]